MSMATKPINTRSGIELRPSIVPVPRELKDGPAMLTDQLLISTTQSQAHPRGRRSERRQYLGWTSGLGGHGRVLLNGLGLRALLRRQGQLMKLTLL